MKIIRWIGRHWLKVALLVICGAYAVSALVITALGDGDLYGVTYDTAILVGLVLGVSFIVRLLWGNKGGQTK